MTLSTLPAPLSAQSPSPAALTAPRSIQARNVPAVPAATSELLRPYSNARSAILFDWHPRERRLLLATRFAESTQLHEVSQPLGARLQLTFEDERVVDGTYHPRRPEWLVFQRDTGGNENYQHYLLDRTTGRVERLSNGIHRYEGATWAEDGSAFLYRSTERNGTDFDIYRYDLASRTSRRLLEVSGSWSVGDWSRDGKLLALEHFVSAVDRRLHLLDVASGSLRQLSPTDAGLVQYRSALFSPDGASLYVLTDRGSQFLRLTRLDLESGLWTQLTPDLGWDVDSFTLSQDGGLLAFEVNEDGASRIHLLDAASGAELPAPPLPLGVVVAMRFRPGSRELGFTLSSSRSPGDIYSYDPARGQLERWTSSEVGGLDPARFVEPQLVRFPTFDRLPGPNAKTPGPPRTIPAWTYRPDAARFPGRRPVYIDVHGGPEGQSRPSFLGSDNVFVEELGVVLIFPNVRGSTGYGRDYLNLDNGFLREDSVKDLGALLDWIATQPDLDASRVMIGGGSYGGYMALASQVFYSDRLAGGVDVVGISNFVTFLTNTQGYRRDLRRVEYGDERDPAMRAFLERISPLSSVARMRGPLLVAQGANDPRVPLSESDQMVAALEQRGVEVWYVVGLDEGHGFAKKSNAHYLNAVQFEFLKRFLLAPR
jgi:dipeptidyl aminopeptidase/acylaminoacyl peptidase